MWIHKDIFNSLLYRYSVFNRFKGLLVFEILRYDRSNIKANVFLCFTSNKIHLNIRKLHTYRITVELFSKSCYNLHGGLCNMETAMNYSLRQVA